MEPTILSPELTVDQVLSRWSQAIPVFMRLRMSCVGCPMSPFETVRSAAETYGVPIDQLMSELDEALAAETN